MSTIKPSISNYVIGFLLSLVLLLIIYFSIVIYFKSQENTDTALVNVAGRNRMLSQKIAFNAEKLFREDSKEAANQLEGAIALHNLSLKILKEGGKSPIKNDDVILPQASGQDLATIIKIETAWKPFSENATSILNWQQAKRDSLDQEIISEALNYVSSHAEELLVLNNELVQNYIEISDNRKATFVIALVSISVFVFFFFCCSFYMLKKNILDVLKRISITADDVANGDFDEKLPSQKDPYLSKITDAVNDLGVNINQASKFAASMGEGNFEYQFNSVRGGNKLFIELDKMRDKLRKVAEDDKRRNWATEGLSKFADILRDDKKGIHALGGKVISECIKYLEANQGSLFVLEKEEDGTEVMSLLASYAWDRQKSLQKKFRKGESLVGQAWIEQDIIYLSEIPDKYVTITSGLGDANPRELLIVPLITNDEIFGIIEIATFKKIEGHHIDFMKRLGENIASSLASAFTMKKTEDLLQKSQIQAEELGAQEEEMRQNMEELQATQEQMERSRQEQASEIEKLKSDHKKNTERYRMLSLVADHTDNSVIITGPEGLIEYVNSGFSRMTDYQLGEVLGKKPGSFLQGKDTNPATVKRIREKLNAEEPFYEEILNYDKKGNEYWISLSINPVFENGKLANFVSVQADITETKQKALDQQSQVEAVSRNLATIEFDLNGIIQDANEIFLNTMGYNLAEVKGKHHKMFMKKEDLNQHYEQMWENLRMGKTHEGEFERVDKEGKIVWLKSSYTPILDILDRPYKIIKYAHDITESKKIALDFDSQIEAISRNNAIIEFDLNGNIQDANHNFLNSIGYSLKEIKGKHHSMFVFEDDLGPAYEKMWQDLRNGKPYASDFKRKAKNGDVVWLKSTYTPIVNLAGEPYKIVKYAIDITQSKKENLNYQGQLEAINRNYAVIEFDLSGKILSANQIFLDTMDYKAEEITGKHHKMFVLEEDQNADYKQMWDDFNKGIPRSDDFRRKSKSGKIIWLKSIYTPILDLKGTPYKVVKYAQDITKSKELALDFTSQMKAINKSNSIIEFNTEGIIQDANDNFLNLMGYKMEEIIGKHHKIFVPKELQDSSYKKMWTKLKGGEIVSGEVIRIDKKGQSIKMHSTYTPIINASGEVYKVVKFAKLNYYNS